MIARSTRVMLRERDVAGDGRPERASMARRTDQKLELLKRVPLLSDLSGRDIAEVGRLADEIDVPSDKVLMRAGETGQEFYVVVDGTVRIDRDGKTLRRLGPGDFFGEISLVDGGPRTATATTESAAKLLVVAHREFHSLMDTYPSIQDCVMRALASRVRNLEPDAT
jgi:CRP/FNR family transcriptional regulator, cyclic AMP receptor protein